MNKSFTVLLILSLTSIALAIESSPVEGLIIKNEEDLANYMKALLGENTDRISEDLKKYISDNKISIMNAVEQIALLLIEDQNLQKNPNDFKITQNFAKNLGESSTKVTVHNLIGKQPEQIAEYKEKKLKHNHQAHELIGNKDELVRLVTIMQNNQRRLLQTTTQAASDSDISASYITKFFFGLMFLIVVLSLFFAIACMENKKDSLLYAKFIADVGR